MRKEPRGSALLVVVVALLILSVLGVGMLRYGYREVVGATAASREQAMVACAQAARNLLASRLSVLGQDPTLLGPVEVNFGGNVRTVAGHYGGADVTVSQIVPLPPTTTGPTVQAKDVSNVIARSDIPKHPYKAIVRCMHTNGAELELEVGFRFGL